MFDQKQIDAYCSVTAPADLRRQVLNMAAEKAERKPFFQTAGFRSLSAVAACLVLMLAVTLPNSVPAGPEFSLDGSPVTAEAMPLPQSTQVAALSARTAPLVTVPLKLDLSEETTLSVDRGALTVVNPKTEDVLFIGSTGTVSKDCLLTWSISDETRTPCTLTAQTADEVCTIILAFNADENSWTIRCSVE